MARIFNIYFTTQGTTHSAVVSVRQTAFFTEYTLQNVDDSVLSLLPGNKIISRTKDDFIFQNAPNSPSDLMQEIIRAVSNHMHAMNV